MRPFLEISRREIIQLAERWNPAQLIEEYLGDRSEDTPPGEAIDALEHGGTLRLDMEQRRIGGVQAELHIDVLQPTEVAVELAAAVSLKWWLRPLAIPFRPRLRRWIDVRIDEMLDELKEERAATNTDAQPREWEDGAAPSAPPKGVTWTLQVLAPSGDVVYQRTEGSS